MADDRIVIRPVADPTATSCDGTTPAPSPTPGITIPINGPCLEPAHDEAHCANLHIYIGPDNGEKSGSSSCQDNQHRDEPCDCSKKRGTTQTEGDCGVYHKPKQDLVFEMRDGYLVKSQEGKIGADMQICMGPQQVGTKPEIVVIDDTCGPSPVHGGGVKQKPPYESRTCAVIRCEREREKPPCLILNMRTGNPRERNPRYCRKPDCSRL